jgi:hypothetical protein
MPKTIFSPHKLKILQMLQYQGVSNDCGPTTTAMVINSLKKTNLDGNKLAEEMNKPRRNGLFPVIRRIPNWATFPWGMVDVFREYGLDASWRFRCTTQDLKDGLSQGKVLMPIVGSWKPLWAHVMTLLACTPNNHWGFANTQHDHHELYWVRDEIFQHQWRAMGQLVVEVKQPKDR